MASSILDVHNIERSLVLLLVDNGTYAAIVMATGGHGKVAKIELDEIADLSGLKIEHHRVIHLDFGIWVADSAAIVGGDIRDTALAELHALYLAELVRSLLFANAVDDEATLGVIEQAEVLIGFGDIDNIHEADGVGLISAHLTVDVDEAVHEDGDHLLTGQSIPAHEKLT